MDYPPIGDYAIIGDCRTAALVSRHGGIDWYCPERFDGPAVLLRILDWEKGGHLSVAPKDHYTTKRRYRPSTNILETTFETDKGRVRLTDFMPVYRRHESRRGEDVGTAEGIRRLIEGLDGEVEVELSFKPTFDYARATTRLQRSDGGAVATAANATLHLYCPHVELKEHGPGEVRGRVRVREGDRTWVSLRPDGKAPKDDSELEGELDETVRYWEGWVKRCTYDGLFRKEVQRSILTMKLLTYEPTGALVAAPTTSLPEDVGGVRNWDYRYSWLRDSSLILYSLMTVGFESEAADYLQWLRRTQLSNPGQRPQIMYRIDGGRDIPESTLDHLSGYRDSRPVRIGNGAATQRQLDIFGEVTSSAYLHYVGQQHPDTNVSNSPAHPDQETWTVLRSFVDRAAQRWQLPDEGIWEVRGGPRQFLYSRLMCWVALDRGIKLAEREKLQAPLEHWHQTRDAIKKAILEKGYSERVGAFTQSFGSDALDASALVIPWIGFLPPSDRRVRSTVDRIRKDLTADGLVYRYQSTDGLPGGEGTFTLCSFWLVRALALEGRVDEAHDLFDKVMGYANDVGLFSEEIDARDGAALGNFPQGFTHLGLVGAAVDLAKSAKHGGEQEARTEAERVHHARNAASDQRGKSGVNKEA